MLLVTRHKRAVHIHVYPGVPHSEDFVRELLNLLVEQSWSVAGQLLNDQ